MTRRSGYVKHGGWWTACAAMALAGVGLGGVSAEREGQKLNTGETEKPPPESRGLEQATFGGGCFWCTEAVFLRLRGVERVVSGYSGGRVPNPTYQAVCTGATGHAEVVQITYDPQIVSYKELLEVFWKTHDPTTLNRQGPDVGTQYRSVIFFHSEEQKKLAEYYKNRLNEARAFGSPVVTEISPFTAFYPAEDYHQNFYQRNPRQQYCRAVVRPKVEKFEKAFREKLKPLSDWSRR